MFQSIVKISITFREKINLKLLQKFKNSPHTIGEGGMRNELNLETNEIILIFSNVV